MVAHTAIISWPHQGSPYFISQIKIIIFKKEFMTENLAASRFTEQPLEAN